MGVKRTTTLAPPGHPKTKRGRTKRETTKYQFPLSVDEVDALVAQVRRDVDATREALAQAADVVA